MPNQARIAVRVGDLVDTLGNNRLARVLQVSQSQPARWRTETEVPSPENAKRIIDLDYVVTRFGQIWPADLFDNWLLGPNPFLGGARPVDVLAMEGPRPLIDALDAEEQGAYA